MGVKTPRRGPSQLSDETRTIRPRGVLRLVAAWERVELRLRHTHAIPGAEEAIFRIEFWRYRGRAITLPDGVRVRQGERVAILHLRNSALARLMRESGVWGVLRLMVVGLRALAAWAATPDFPSDVRALYGVSMLSRAAPRLGFTVRARRHTPKAWIDRRFLLALLAIYHPEGAERLLEGHIHEAWPAETWMSLGELARRYGVGAPTR
jgi:hypothetical protein